VIGILSALRHKGILGMNRRNAGFTLRCNARKFYPRVDDKVTTKRHCEEAGIPVPKLLALATHHFELRELARKLEGLERFVLKPSHGAMGNGILVVKGRDGDDFVRANGRRLTLEDLRYHAAGIISGLYSLGGQDDAAMVEEMLEVHPDMAEVSVEGVPDIRVII
jgi:alpha-L-glutamate ligase-like protein